MERRDLLVTSTYDIETQDWDIPVLCGQYLADGMYRETRDIEELTRWLMEPGVHVAHNGGNFDVLAVLDVLLRLGVKCTGLMSGSRIIALKFGQTVLADSAALWPERLADITEQLLPGERKQRLELPCVCGEYCGGYCSLRRDMSPEFYRRTSEYLYHDCRGLFLAFEELREFAADNDLDLGLTIGGSAYRNMVRMLGLLPDRHTVKEHFFRRSAFYGGRTQAFHVGMYLRNDMQRPAFYDGPITRYEEGYDYDVVGMYSSILRDMSFPQGECRPLSGAYARQAFAQGKSGIYTALVTVPESHIPPLPLRGKNRLWYPHGTFEACYTQPELQNAVDCYGVKIHSFGESRVYERAAPVFGPWIEHVGALRIQAGKKSPLGLFLKRYQNCIFGRLSIRPERRRIMINPDRIKEGDIPKSDCVYERHSLSVDDSSRPIWGAYTSSWSRILLGRKMHEGPPESVLYCDTDGCPILGPRRGANVGSAIGQWECEELRGMYSVAPKIYAKWLGSAALPPGYYGPELAPDTRAKGVRLKKGQIPVPGEYSAHAGVASARSYDGDKFFRRNTGTRKIRQRAGDRIILADGQRTRAPHISEVIK